MTVARPHAPTASDLVRALLAAAAALLAVHAATLSQPADAAPVAAPRG